MSESERSEVEVFDNRCFTCGNHLTPAFEGGAPRQCDDCQDDAELQAELDNQAAEAYRAAQKVDAHGQPYLDVPWGERFDTLIETDFSAEQLQELETGVLTPTDDDDDDGDDW